ncbi:hypothetical protein CQ12_11560 [Bradyrhizobium jicamae]|uniref:Uncharacterized protein n=1 Tax=Bradyrhizobium jicamae TaxID=280332 RepID=A0A0R3LEG6_9BRAD|nr:hypothetical protein CQ12_11560 [Bradyrhizobium jicamae]
MDHLTNLFRVAKFIAVRVAENPKGPQFALGALLGAGGFVAGQLNQLIAAWWASQSFATALLGT